MTLGEGLCIFLETFLISSDIRAPMVAQLKIERIECVPLSMPLPRTFRGSNYFMTHRCTIITRVFTSAGIVGEVYNGDEFETQAEVVRIILDEIQPMLIGKDAFNIEGCWQAMRKPSYNILRDRKLAMCAQACVDSALWDAVGKALQVPLYKLWGGYTDRLPVDLHRRLLRGRQDARRFRPRDGADQGGRARRLQVQGRRTNARRRMPSACASRAQAAGDDFILIVDANQGWTLRQAVEFSRLSADLEHPLVRGAGALVQRPPRHGGRPQPDRHSDLRRAERDQPSPAAAT